MLNCNDINTCIDCYKLGECTFTKGKAEEIVNRYLDVMAGDLINEY